MKMFRLTEEQLEQIRDRFEQRGARITRHSTEPPEKQSEVAKVKRQRKRPKTSRERELYQQVTLSGLPAPECEYLFHPDRKWRIDLAWPSVKLAVEIEGAVHRIKSRFASDIEKYNELTLRGWALVRVTNSQVRSGEALNVVVRLFDLIGPLQIERLRWREGVMGKKKEPRQPEG